MGSYQRSRGNDGQRPPNMTTLAIRWTLTKLIQEAGRYHKEPKHMSNLKVHPDCECLETQSHHHVKVPHQCLQEMASPSHPQTGLNRH